MPLLSDNVVELILFQQAMYWSESVTFYTDILAIKSKGNANLLRQLWWKTQAENNEPWTSVQYIPASKLLHRHSQYSFEIMSIYTTV